jgi:very-short-patch-repair endonuclease
MLAYSRRTKPIARSLRLRMTDAEHRLWFRLRRKQLHGVQFYRQKPLGNYMVDFFAPAVRLVVEVDGGQHLEAAAMAADARRTELLHGMGLLVLRFDNRQVLLETDAVIEQILEFVGAHVRRN